MLLNQWLAAARGRGAALAKHLDVAPSMVTKMASGEKQVPLDHCPLIQAFTGNEVTCEELRADKVEYFALIRAQANNRPAHPLRRATDRPHPMRRSTDVASAVGAMAHGGSDDSLHVRSPPGRSVGEGVGTFIHKDGGGLP